MKRTMNLTIDSTQKARKTYAQNYTEPARIGEVLNALQVKWNISGDIVMKNRQERGPILVLDQDTICATNTQCS